MSHLSQEQLIAFRDGRSDDPRLREHLATCPQCQRAFDDSRWRRMLMSLRRGDDRAHPPQERLLAFWDNALSTESAREVERHVASCRRCTAVYTRLRAIPPERAYSSPSPELLQRVRSQIPARTVHTVGSLTLRRVGELFGLAFTPDEVAFGSFAAPCCADDDLIGQSAGQPMSARARMLRSLGRARQPALDRAEPPPPQAVYIDTEQLQIEVRVDRERDEPRLGLWIRSVEPGKPARDVPVYLESEDGTRFESRTDRSGHVETPFPAGDSQLGVRGPQHVRLRLHRDP